MKHILSDFMYNNEAAPSVDNLQDAMDYLFMVLYPQTRDAVDWETDQGDGSTFLPLAGNTVGEYRNVINAVDNGDTTYKTAGYLWAKYDGQATATWHRTTVFDWGTGDIASDMIERTKLLYYFKRGMDDVDENGDAIVDITQGQSLFGGISAGTNLTLNANNGDIEDLGSPDGVAHTGFIQLNDSTRPVLNEYFSLGLNSFRFLKGWFKELAAGNITIKDNSITAGVNADIDLGDSNLKSVRDLFADDIYYENTLHMNEEANGRGTLTSTKLSHPESVFYIDKLVGDAFVRIMGKMQSDSAEIGFSKYINHTLTPTDATDTFAILYDKFTAKEVTLDSLVIDNITIDDNSIISDTDLRLESSDIASAVVINSDLETGDIATIGDVDIDGTLTIDKIDIDDNTISTNIADTDLVLDGNGTGLVTSATDIVPSTDGSASVGTLTRKWLNIYLSNSIKNAGFTYLIADLMKLRLGAYRADGVTAASDGDVMVWATNKFVAESPADIDHSDLINHDSTDDHLQYAKLEGRSAGQLLEGGVLNTEVLGLGAYHGSTYIVVGDKVLQPNVDKDFGLGASDKQYKDLYMSGEFKGGRLENKLEADLAGIASVDRVGRLVYTTDKNAVYVDQGGTFKRVGLSSYKGTHSAADLKADHGGGVFGIDISGSMDDARDAIWQLSDPSNDYEVLGVKITKTETHVMVMQDEGLALPAGNYRLTGVEA